ncbi:aminoglycoside phosphotransferase [Parvibaculum lavamentivorans DS-1]|uniref:Aminoglycoside phosphotransferase n=1 Tax=Parvibaculum lavamentivorans (strain DS-1 / DSM 13023 / NCIMB 13966) TaxID=402881 RepID=A7HQT9_PARL1|nr:phosphotransferase [Parvibaculum lavamentivorans]ABS62272.1 aminoglycoside phosphotransferase [Parvibaculum lavamentivorans DS-1]
MAEAAGAEQETTAIREAHRFDLKRLEAYCRDAVEGFGGTLEVRQFEGGQSNPTFLLTTTGAGGGKRYVMRKKPPGQLLASAHQVDREYRVMKALAETDVPVPHMYALCEDDSVIGTSFYVMEYLEGRVFRESVMPGASEAERRAVYANLAENLAKLHKVDYEKVGLGDFGRPGNYFERQTGRWIKQYRGAQTADIPSMEKLIDYLPAHIPDEPSVTIAHGDYRLGNTMFHPTEPRMIAVLDWELCTIGHPFADVAYTCMYDLLGIAGGATEIDRNETPGIPTEQEFVAEYCRHAGRDGIPNWNFYLAFSMFRLASISQGVYKRGLDGNASSERAMTLGDSCRLLADRAWQIIQRPD